MNPKPDGKKPDDKKPDDKRGDTDISAPATLTVTLPADAKLTVDGTPTKSTSAVRSFVTPDLNPGKTYSYVLKAEYPKDDKMVTEEMVVKVQAGKETKISFTGTGTTAVSSR